MITVNNYVYENNNNTIQESGSEEKLTDYLKKNVVEGKRMKRGIKNIFRRVDKNSDKKILKEELFSGVIEALKYFHNQSTSDEFEIVDGNKDRKVSLIEYFMYEHWNILEGSEYLTNIDISNDSLTMRKKLQRQTNKFKAADSDGDELLTLYEYLPFKYSLFFPQMAHIIVPDYIEFIDADEDGGIDRDEYVDFFQSFGLTDKGEVKESIRKAEEDFNNYDKDNSGKIDHKEYQDVLKPGYEEPARIEAMRLFEDTDTNKDGMLTLNEIENNAYMWCQSVIIYSSIDGEDDYYNILTGHLEDEL